MNGGQDLLGFPVVPGRVSVPQRQDPRRGNDPGAGSRDDHLLVLESPEPVQRPDVNDVGLARPVRPDGSRTDAMVIEITLDRADQVTGGHRNPD